jgi:hypothetical protein
MEGLDVTADMFNERLRSLVNEINGSEDQRSGLPLQNEPFYDIAQCRKPPSAARRSLIDLQGRFGGTFHMANAAAGTIAVQRLELAVLAAELHAPRRGAAP